MRRIAIIAALFACSLFGQSDILVSVHSPYFDIGRGLAYGHSGVGGVNNNFIFNPYLPQLGTCVWLASNNPTSSHTVTVSTAITADPNITTIIGTEGRWVSSLAFGLANTILNATSVTVPAYTSTNFGSVQLFYIPSRGAARVAVQLSASASAAGTPDTLDIFGSFTDQTTCFSSVNGPAGQPVSAIDSSAAGFNRPIGGTQGNTAFSGPPSGGGYNGLMVAPLISASATALTTLPVNTSIFNGPWVTEKGARWSVTNVGLIGSAAVATEAAGAAGVRHVVDCIAFSAVSTGAIAAASDLVLEVLDGAVPFWTFLAAAPATAGTGVQIVSPTQFCGLGIVGSAATSMTIEFTGGVANLDQVVNFTGYDVQ